MNCDFILKDSVSWSIGQLEKKYPRGAQVLKLRFGLYDDNECTLQLIAKKIHLTPERVRQIEANALRLMRSGVIHKELRLFFE